MLLVPGPRSSPVSGDWDPTAGTSDGESANAGRRSATSRSFIDVDQLLAYAGVHPKEQRSGTKGADPETSWVMAKTGNAYLREAAYRMAVVGIPHNPVISAHYARKRATGKSRMNAVGHCMSKPLSLVWGVWRGGEPFDAGHGSRRENTTSTPAEA